MWWILKWKYNLKITFWVLFLTDVLVKLDVHENDYIDFYKRHKIHVRLVSEVVISFFFFHFFWCTDTVSLISLLPLSGFFSRELTFGSSAASQYFPSADTVRCLFQGQQGWVQNEGMHPKVFFGFFFPWIFKNCVSAVATVTSPQNKLFHQHLL